jgi:hypothetical protein
MRAKKIKNVSKLNAFKLYVLLSSQVSIKVVPLHARGNAEL